MKYILTLIITIFALQSFAQTLPEEIRQAIKLNKEMLVHHGGATSGGGHDVGLEVSSALRFIFKMISEDKGAVYSAQSRDQLLNLEKLIRILVVDENLPAQVNGVTQNSFAYSFNDGENVIILIQSDRWKAAQNPVYIERVLHHELAVLVGLEKTGDYRQTDKFVDARAIFWQKVLSQNFACTFSLFSKKYEGKDQTSAIGQFLGASGVVKQMDTQSGFVTLAKIGNRLDNGYDPSVIARYVISAEGYLRAIISEADVFERGADFKIFQNLRKNAQEQVYFTPYDLLQPQGSVLKSWENYFVQVSCSKI